MLSAMHSDFRQCGVGRSLVEFHIVEITNVVQSLWRTLRSRQLHSAQFSFDGRMNGIFTS